MTPNLDEIRAALAAAEQPKPPRGRQMAWKLDRIRFEANAPTWLAALVEEVERLRELSAQLQVEQDVALAEVERLRGQI